MLVAAIAAVLAGIAPPPANAGFDYQIGRPYPPPAGVRVVTRDWREARPAPGAYSICYVNAFQTQPGSAPARDLVLRRLGADPGWPGEYLLDISMPRRRARAAAWVRPMLERCARKGYRAVELDNLDSWTRFRDVPFGRRDALAYARRLIRRAHALGLAVAQKNTPQLTRAQVRRTGFDFAVAEECGRYAECGRYLRLYGDRVLAIEYRRRDFRRACAAVGDRISVVLRDRAVTAPGSRTYRYDAC
jgi:hypothetical protein